MGWFILLISIGKIGYDYNRRPIYTGGIYKYITSKSLDQRLVGVYIDVGEFQEMEIDRILNTTTDTISFCYTLKGNGNSGKNKLGWIAINSQQVYFENKGYGIMTVNSPITLTSNNNEWEFRKKK
ncbi:MAG: hypothetical protein ACRBFS_25315 [Aureispira sp.]